MSKEKSSTLPCNDSQLLKYYPTVCQSAKAEVQSGDSVLHGYRVSIIVNYLLRKNWREGSCRMSPLK